MNETPKTVNGRTLTKGTCRCGLEVERFVKPGETLKCADCRENDHRETFGWNPLNSRD